MKEQEAYRAIAEKVEVRPFDKDGNRDGNFNFIHRVDVIRIVQDIFNDFDGRHDKMVLEMLDGGG